MKIALCIAVGIVVDIPDDGTFVGAPLVSNPLDDLVARLRREAAFGRDSVEPQFTPAEITAWATALYREFAEQS